MMEHHGAGAVGHPALFRGFPINTAMDYEGKEADVSLNPVTHDNMTCTTMFQWETVPQF